MRTFVLRARAAPTDSPKLLASVGKEAHAEILAHTLMNAIFVAQSHRADVTVYLVLESTPDFSRTIRFEPDAMHDIGGFDERTLLGKIANALDVSRGMGKEEMRPVPGHGSAASEAALGHLVAAQPQELRRVLDAIGQLGVSGNER